MDKFFSPEVVDLIAKIGVSAFSIAGIVYVVVNSQKEREKNQRSFMEYVEKNNHQTTDIVGKSVQALVECNESMKAHTKSIDVNTEISRNILSALVSKKI